MNRKSIEKIIAGHYRKIRLHTKCFVTDINADAVHLFRVEYKKLRALLRMLLAKQKPGKNKKAIKELKRIFTISGAIRDVQLLQWLVASATKKASSKPRAYLNYLQQQIVSLKTILAQLPIKKIIATSKSKVILSLPQKFEAEKFQAFFKMKKEKAEAIIAAGNFSDEKLHRIRKILKDLFYNLIIYQKHSSAKKQPRLKETTGYYEELIKALGIFHDKCIAISLLQTYPDSQSSKTVLLPIKKNWVKEKQSMKRELVKKLTTAHFLLP